MHPTLSAALLVLRSNLKWAALAAHFCIFIKSSYVFDNVYERNTVMEDENEQQKQDIKQRW